MILEHFEDGVCVCTCSAMSDTLRPLWTVGFSVHEISARIVLEWVAIPPPGLTLFTGRRMCVFAIMWISLYFLNECA